MKSTVSFSKAKNTLACLWVIGFLIPSSLLLIQTVIGKRYVIPTDTGSVDMSGDVWGWFLPAMVPTLALILGVLVADAQGKAIARQKISAVLFWIGLALTIFYLLTVIGLLVFMQPVEIGGKAGGLATLKASSIYLGVFQGFVTAVFGAFFVNKAED